MNGAARKVDPLRSSRRQFFQFLEFLTAFLPGAGKGAHTGTSRRRARRTQRSQADVLLITHGPMGGMKKKLETPFRV